MRILALDDSELELLLLELVITETCPQAELFSFGEPSALLAFARENTCDVAFLEIWMWGMNGFAVAKELKEYNPEINIIYMTANYEYALDTFGVFPSGFILKPLTRDAVERQIRNLPHPVDKTAPDETVPDTIRPFGRLARGMDLTPPFGG